ncbi:MAG: DUF4886 domain-containing protein [Clostridia bacterium]|nr:DUF4886 domain-containing protein [Clostridia bacterium]
MKILAIGNSFAEDTFWLSPEVALSMGVEDFTFAHLYCGGCSINQHLLHARENRAAYLYQKNCGGIWEENRYDVTMRPVLEEEQWDWIILSTGTGDGSRWTEVESYKNLAQLIACVKPYVPEQVRFAFNVTWAGEATFERYEQPDLQKFAGDQIAMMDAINAIVREYVAVLPEIATIIPTGIAVQNLRAACGLCLCRDDYHLSYDVGRYAAASTAMMVLTGCEDVERITYTPLEAGLNKQVLEAVANALKTPYSVTWPK